MFEIKECTSPALINNLCKIFGAHNYNLGDRAWVFTEGEPKGIGLIALESGAVIIKAITDCGDAAYKDALYRAVLFNISAFNKITVKVKGEQEYLKPFGFEFKDGFMQIQSDLINFKCN